MGGINVGKLVVGGLVAGLVYNIGQSIVHLFLLAEQSAAMTESMGLPEPTGAQIAFFWVLGFVIGLTTIFVYAGFRPRFGASAGTALIAGAMVFLLAELIPAAFYIGVGMYSLGQYLPFLITTLIVLCVSAVAGAAPYTE